MLPQNAPDGLSTMFWSNITPEGALQNASAVYTLGSAGLRRMTSLGLAVETVTAQHRPSDYTLSPDGPRLAVSSDNGVTVIDTATGATVAIAAPGLGENLHFSPDGRTVLFNVAPFTGHYWFPYLYVAPVSGGTAVRQVRGAIDGRRPVAGGTIVFTGPGPSNDTITTDAPWNVYTMMADGRGIEQLTNYTASSPQGPLASQASFSSDGKRILFVTTTPTSTPTSLIAASVMQADGTGLRSLPIDNRSQVVIFSEDGTRMAWSLAGIVHVQNVDTGDDRVVTEFAQSDIAEMEFAPDNSRLYLLVGETNAYGYRATGSALYWGRYESPPDRSYAILASNGMGKPLTLLEGLCGHALSLGAQSIGVEYKDRREWVFAYKGGTGIGIANYASSSADAKELRGALAAAKKPLRTVIGGQVCILKVRVFDSFGEDAFEVTIDPAPKLDPSVAPSFTAKQGLLGDRKHFVYTVAAAAVENSGIYVASRVAPHWNQTPASGSSRVGQF